MTRYAVTGISGAINQEQRLFIETAIDRLPDVTEFTTGGATGVDTIAALAGHVYHPKAFHRLLYPEGEAYNYDLIHCSWWGQIRGIPGGYLRRDDALVESCDTLVAFPRTEVEERRSGTWATVRRAQKVQKNVILLPLQR